MSSAGAATETGRNTNGTATPTPSSSVHRSAVARENKSRPVLAVQLSATLRQELIEEITRLASTDLATDWVKRRLGAKNTLTTEHARAIEAAFADRMRELQSQPNLRDQMINREQSTIAQKEAAQLGIGHENPGAADKFVAVEMSNAQTGNFEKRRPLRGSKFAPQAVSIYKGALALAEPRRYRDKDHLRFIAGQPCTACGRQPSEPHHLRFAQARALGRKVSDEFTVPLCRVHPREIHRSSDEMAWWKTLGLDPMPIALKLWQYTRKLSSTASTESALQSAVPSSPLSSDTSPARNGSASADVPIKRTL